MFLTACASADGGRPEEDGTRGERERLVIGLYQDTIFATSEFVIRNAVSSFNGLNELYYLEIKDYEEKDGSVKFSTNIIDSMAMLQLVWFEYSGTAVFLGFPAVEEGGHIVQSDMVLSINQSCLNKEAAWSFVSFLLDDKFQTNGFSSLPIRKSALEIHMSEDKGMAAAFKGSDIVFESYPATEEEKFKLKDLIARVTKAESLNEQISDILNEEAQSFFTGAKSAEAAADVAANRIEIYLSELR